MKVCKAFFCVVLFVGLVAGVFSGGVWLVGLFFDAYDVESCNHAKTICEQWEDMHGGNCSECVEFESCRVRGVI